MGCSTSTHQRGLNSQTKLPESVPKGDLTLDPRTNCYVRVFGPVHPGEVRVKTLVN